MPITNFSDIINGTGIIEYSMQAYVGILGAFTYPLIFCGIIGYVYVKQQSVVAAAIATLILFTAFDIAAGVETFIMIMHIFVTIAIGSLFLLLFTRIRR